MHLVIAVIDAPAPLQAVLRELDGLRVEPDAVELLSNEPHGAADPIAARWSPQRVAERTVPDIERHPTRDWEAVLRRKGIPEAPAHQYAESVRRGATVLVARVPSARAESIRARLNRLGLLDIDAHAELWADNPDYRYPGTTPMRHAPGRRPGDLDALGEPSDRAESSPDTSSQEPLGESRGE